MIRAPLLAVMTAASMLALAGCGQDPVAETPQLPRLVRVVALESAPPVSGGSFSGRIEAEDEAALGFRIAGRLASRAVNVGDTVAAGQIIGALEPQDQENALRSARADLVAAEGRLVQAQNAYERRRTLLNRDVVSQADFDAAEQARRAAQAAVDAAAAQLRIAEENLGFTVLAADAPGVVTAIGAEPGEFVRAGQKVVRLARRDGRDAVFDVPQSALAEIVPGERFTVALTIDPAVRADGRVREVSPQADPVTRTHQVRVGLDSPRPAFRLGATVTGTPYRAPDGLISLPVSALAPGTEAAVWVVDPAALTVSRRTVEIAGRDGVTVWVSGGLKPGEIVVSAGAATLAEGQAVRLPGGQS
jgi:RND family efflux transporter MFP subunit